jgi:hypothetical protein
VELLEGNSAMDMLNKKPPPDTTTTSIMAYALLTTIATLLLFASLAFLRYGIG